MAIKAGIIQTPSYESNEKGILEIAKMIDHLGKKEADIVCLPEQWLKKNELDFEKDLIPFKKLAKEHSMTIIPGAFYEKKGDTYSISAPVIGYTGELEGRQEKIHPFDYENKLIRPGKEARIFSTNCKFGILVCYDMVFPEVAKTLAKKGAQILLSPSRIVKRGIKPWHMYVQVRALENRIPILAANVHSHRFGGQSITVEMINHKEVMIPKTTVLSGKQSVIKRFNLEQYSTARESRYADERVFS